jgi:endonuclease/exonuclease/phosphatase family metal-dependent hydrolase
MAMRLYEQCTRRRRSSCFVAISAGLMGFICILACDRGQPGAAVPPVTQAATTARAAATAPVVRLTPGMQALASQPGAGPTGLFLDRRAPGDLRVVSYNVNRDSIFPDKDTLRAERFQRVLLALDPDILALQEINNKDAADVVALLNAIDPRPAGGTWYAYDGNTSVIASKYPLRLTADRLPSPTYRDPAMASVDLPDGRFSVDVYVVSNHFKCCGGRENDPIRQQQADAVVGWLRDARSPGGQVDIPERTPIIVAGDLNLVGGPEPLATLLTGDVHDEATYGPDAPPDWDGTALTDAHPRHNGTGSDDYTWRDDDSQWAPGRLDFVLYTDSVLDAVNSFVLDTTIMPDDELERARLEKLDVTLDETGRHFDHLPVVVDFRVAGQ